MGKKKYKCKFNPERCISCRYRCKYGIGNSVKVDKYNTIRIACNYATVTGDTCLRKINNEIVDLRGDDYNDCKLYVEGEAYEDDEE